MRLVHNDSKKLNAQLDSEHIKVLLENLLHQLSNDDIEASDTWEILSSLLPDIIGKHNFNRLDHQIQGFDFEIAYNTLRSILADYPNLASTNL